MEINSQKDIEKIDKAIASITDTDKNLSQIFSEISSILKLTKKSLSELEKQKENLENEKDALKLQTNDLQDQKNKLDKEKNLLESEKNLLELGTKKLEQEKRERDAKIGELTGNQKKLLEEYDILKKDLRKFQELAADAEDQDFNFEEIQNLLRIYMVLLEEIWQSKPHYKILYLLHGDKEELNKDDIKGATGIAGAMVLRAIHELAGSNLIIYNEDTGMVKLTKRMFPKQKKE